MYTWLERDLASANNKWIWKALIPLKIKILMWIFFRDAILTRENLQKRKWLGNPSCSFCSEKVSPDIYFWSVIWQEWFGELLAKLLGLTVA